MKVLCSSPSQSRNDVPEQDIFPEGAVSAIADPGWVGNDLSCTFTATAPDGRTTTVKSDVYLRTILPDFKLAGCVSSTPTTSPASASMTCNLANITRTKLTAITYSTTIGGETAQAGGVGTTVSGPSERDVPPATCQLKLTTNSTTGYYFGSLDVYLNAVRVHGVPVSLTVNPASAGPPKLLLTCANAIAGSPTTPASVTCALANTGGPATAISYSAFTDINVSGPATCATNCGGVFGCSNGNWHRRMTPTPCTQRRLPR